MVPVVGAMRTAFAIKLRGTHGLEHLRITAVTSEGAPAGEVDVVTTAVRHVNQHVARVVDLHHVPCRRRGTAQTAITIVGKVGGFFGRGAGGIGDAVGVLIRAERIRLQT